MKLGIKNYELGMDRFLGGGPASLRAGIVRCDGSQGREPSKGGIDS